MLKHRSGTTGSAGRPVEQADQNEVPTIHSDGCDWQGALTTWSKEFLPVTASAGLGRSDRSGTHYAHASPMQENERRNGTFT